MEKKIIIFLLIIFSLSCHDVFAGEALCDIDSGKSFAGRYFEVLKVFEEMDKCVLVPTYRFDMIYPETDKKSGRLEQLGLDYDGGELYFLEVLEKDNGLYISFNNEKKLDAILVEVRKNKYKAFSFTYNEIIFSIMACMLDCDFRNTDVKDRIDKVINGTAAYIDIYADNGFYIRVKNVAVNNEFYRVAIFRAKA